MMGVRKMTRRVHDNTALMLFLFFVLIACFFLTSCASLSGDGPAPQNDTKDGAVTAIEQITYGSVQLFLPNSLLVMLASDLPYYQDVNAPGGFFAPAPLNPPKCVAPNYYVLAGVPGPLNYIVLQACAEIVGTVAAVEWPRDKTWTWWHDTYYLVPDEQGLTNSFSGHVINLDASAPINSLKIEQPQGYKLPVVGQRVRAKGVWLIDLAWGFPALVNGEAQSWEPL